MRVRRVIPSTRFRAMTGRPGQRENRALALVRPVARFHSVGDRFSVATSWASRRFGSSRLSTDLAFISMTAILTVTLGARTPLSRFRSRLLVGTRRRVVVRGDQPRHRMDAESRALHPCRDRLSGSRFCHSQSSVRRV